MYKFIHIFIKSILYKSTRFRDDVFKKYGCALTLQKRTRFLSYLYPHNLVQVVGFELLTEYIFLFLKTEEMTGR